MLHKTETPPLDQQMSSPYIDTDSELDAVLASLEASELGCPAAGKRILIVQDDPGLVPTLTRRLEREGYTVETDSDGRSALERIQEAAFDLIILDVTLPGMNGLDVCKELRHRGIKVPILILTARGELAEKVIGLKLGADDYLTKPFQMIELLARLEALSRRAGARAEDPASDAFGSVRVDFRRGEVTRGGQPVELSSRELELLQYFLRHRGTAISRAELLREVWGYHTTACSRTVDVHVSSLRQKLETNSKYPEHILTVHRVGYKFIDQAS
jgi:two-component system alkaline phosphatase synthesis response regulator PhoP